MLDRFWPFAGRLYENLFPAEVRTLLQAQTGQLAIVAHHALNCLPFGALGHGPDTCIGHRWQTTIISSMGAYMQADRRRDPLLARDARERPKAVIVGCDSPQTVSVQLLPVIPNTETLHFQQLQAAEAEAKSIGRLLGQDAYVGPSATWSNIADDFFDSDVVHFATHAFWHADVGELSFILLAPDPARGNSNTVKARDIMNYITTAELVVLSGCQTGLGYAHPDSYISLAQSFLIAGARSVLVSLWPIFDDTTLIFMRRFYERLVGGETVASALQAVQSSFRVASHSSDIHAWAPFQLIGRPFYNLYRSNVFHKYSGPVFCGGDVLWPDAHQGQEFPLEKYEDLTQGLDEEFLISADKVVRLAKQTDMSKANRWP